MAKNRGLQLRTFLTAISPSLLERYFALHPELPATPNWFHLNPDAFAAYVERPENAELVEPVLEDFESIDQLCREGVGLVLRAHHRFGLPVNESLTPQELAMELFLHSSEVFEYARSHYLLFQGGATLSVFHLGSETIQTGPQQVDAFATGVQEWYRSQAKGEHAKVQCFTDRDQVIFLVQRGLPLETRPIWEGAEIVVSTQRPAAEDVLVFDPGESILRLRSAAERDRVELLRLFAVHMAGDESLAERALAEEVFSLESVRGGAFRYQGKGAVKRIDLVGVKLKLHGVSSSVITLRADEVRDSLKYDLKGLTLKSGDLMSATFRFHIQRPGEKRTSPVTFVVEPPSRTSLGEHRNSVIVLAYLEEQGVKLRR